MPPSFWCAVFDSLHSLSHPSIWATQCLVTAWFVWQSINSNVRKWAQTGLQCQRLKIQQHTVTPFSTFGTPDARFDHVHLDIVRPLPSSNGFTYLLTRVDHFTRWPEAILIADITAETVVNTFVARWVTWVGVPSVITTDRGGQFQSRFWQQLVRLLGTKWVRTTAYRPIANSLVERFHRQLKVALKCLSIPERWTNLLSIVLLSARTALNNDLPCSAAEVVYGTTLCLPAEFFHSSSSNTIDQVIYITRLKETMMQLRASPTHHHMRQRPFVIMIFLTAPTFSSDRMQYAGVYNNHTMVLTRSSNMEAKPSLLVSMASRR